MHQPYYVDEYKTRHNDNGRKVVEYALMSVNEGRVVTGTDLVLMHKIADLLNDDENGRDIHR